MAKALVHGRGVRPKVECGRCRREAELAATFADPKHGRICGTCYREITALERKALLDAFAAPAFAALARMKGRRR